MPQSLQCPRCNGSVRVTDQAAGRRVKCPHCEQTFLAPGINESEKSPDDDWLSLEESINPPVAPPQKKSPTAPISLSPEDSVLDDGLNEQALPKDPTPSAKDLFEDQASIDDLMEVDAGDSDSEEDEFTLKLPENAILKTPAKTGNPATLGSGFLKNEEDLLKQYVGDEFDDFTSGSEPLPSTTRANKAKGISGIPGASGATKRNPEAHPSGKGSNATNPRSPASPARDAQPIEYATEYRVKCKVCGSFIYAKANQAGKMMQCSDCFSEILIPSPPKIKKRPTLNLDEAATFNFESKPKKERGPDPFQKSASQLLDEAERAELEAPSRPTDYDTPNVVEWITSLLSPFRDLSVVAHLVALCAFGIIPTLIALKLEMSILLMGLFPGGLLLGLLSAACGMAILLATANDEPRVSQWPTLDPYNWLEQLTLVGGAAMLAAVPCWALSTLILGPHLLSVVLTMFSIYLLFPFVILSMLDMDSVFKPFSSELSRSVSKCEEAWGGFYFSSGILFVGTFLCFVVASAASPSGCAIISIIAAETTTFIYFGMIGRLAYAIGQSVNAPPRKDEANESEGKRE